MPISIVVVVIISFFFSQYFLEKKASSVRWLRFLNQMSFWKAAFICGMLMAVTAALGILVPSLSYIPIAITIFLASYLMKRHEQRLEERTKV